MSASPTEKLHAFADGLGGPAVEDIPGCALFGVVVDARDAQARPEFAEAAIERRRRETATQFFAQLHLEIGPSRPNDFEGIAGELREYSEREPPFGA